MSPATEGRARLDHEPVRELTLVRLGLHKPANFLVNLVADSREYLHLLVVASLGAGWVFEAPVERLSRGGKGGAALAGVVADRDDVGELLAGERVDVFGFL